jgi:hypothetical protein
MPGPLDLTNTRISFTFDRLIQTDGVGGFYNGLGDPVSIGGGGEFYYQTTPPTPVNLGARWIDSDNGIEYVWVYDGSDYVWMQPTQLGQIRYQATYINVSAYSPTFAYDYYGVTYSSGICTVTLPLGTSPSDDGRSITIADEVGGISNYGRGILIVPSGVQQINGHNNILMKLERMSLTFLFRGGNWKTI